MTGRLSGLFASPRVWPVLLGLVLIVFGGILAVGGAQLASLGGSWYYLAAGVALMISGVLFIRRDIFAVWVYLATAAATLAWSFWEVGYAFWPLVPRITGPLFLTTLVLLVVPQLSPEKSRKMWYRASGILVAILIGFVSFIFSPHGVVQNESAASAIATATTTRQYDNDWRHWGRSPAGTRFAPFDQINRDNVQNLEVAWTFRTGEIPQGGPDNQNVPLQIGDSLYICTALNKVYALDADTGEQRWFFDAKPVDNGLWKRCRGLSYFEAEASSAGSHSGGSVPAGQCQQRIVMTTTDGRLLQLDARNGELCREFGTNGQVDLKVGIGQIKPAFYVQTSAPTVAGNRIIVGGWVFDNQDIDVPSGAVRAYDATTGQLIWAWDIGNPDLAVPPPADYVYTRGTPNVWSTPSFDEDLGLVYLPTGSPSPDRWGGLRRDFDEKFSTSVVALEIETGKVRWNFQTVHHDLWDYDVASQPALYDLPDNEGGTTPVLVQATKLGQLFVLDRRTGEPVRRVEERPVPQGAASGDKVSPTQPFSAEMPLIGVKHLVESDMWGATLIDQMLCRISFRSMRYDGPYTPPGFNVKSLEFPGNAGGMNWGSVSINEETGMMIVNDIRLPLVTRLVDQLPNSDQPWATHILGNLYEPMRGTPFGVETTQFLSALGIPCIAPPWGTFSGIDLHTGKLIWQTPAGTVRDVAMGGMKVGLPIPLGMPTIAGSVSTRSGLFFFAGTQDYYLRAMDQTTGKELWKAELPVGSIATPMTYQSPKTGKQFVVITAGGASHSPNTGDYIIAYSLPLSSAGVKAGQAAE